MTYWIGLGACGLMVVLALIGGVLDRRERRRRLKQLYEEMGEKQFRASVRRALCDLMVDRYMP